MVLLVTPHVHYNFLPPSLPSSSPPLSFLIHLAKDLTISSFWKISFWFLIFFLLLKLPLISALILFIYFYQFGVWFALIFAETWDGTEVCLLDFFLLFWCGHWLLHISCLVCLCSFFMFKCFHYMDLVFCVFLSLL